MSDVQTQINRLVGEFVEQVTALAKQLAITTLESGLKNGGRLSLGFAGVPSRGRGKGIKRTSDELDRIGEKLIGFVGDNPGLRIEQINKAIGTSTRDLQLPIRKLIAEGRLKTKGHKRSTQYFASEGKARGGRRKKRD